MSSSRRGPVVFLARVLLFLLLFVGVGEVWFRAVIPASQVPLYYEDSQWKIWRFDPKGPTDGRWTVGRLARGGGLWHINNEGWNSSVDYLPKTQRRLPLIAMFGDSFIQAFDSDPDQHVDVYLADQLTPKADVYSFALGGYCLEQYVALGRYVAQKFSPDLLVLVLGPHDVDDSMRRYGVLSPYLWQVESSDGGFVELPPRMYAASRFALPARRSALLSYLHYNADLPLPGMRVAAIPSPLADEGAGSPSGGPTWQDLLPAAQYMIAQLCAENPGVPIVFAWQADRYLPEDQVSTTPLSPDGEAVRVASQRCPDCYFLDLREAFSRDWAVHHHRFEAVDGIHWTAYTNQMVANALAAFIKDKGLLERETGKKARIESRPLHVADVMATWADIGKDWTSDG